MSSIFFLHLYVFQCINESVKAHTTFRLCCLFKEAFNELENFKYATRHEDYWFIFRQCFVHILPADLTLSAYANLQNGHYKSIKISTENR